MAAITEAEVDQIVAAGIPWVTDLDLRVEAIGEGTCRARLPFGPRKVRPGGTVAGPMLVALASYAAYVAVLSAVGRIEKAAVIHQSADFFKGTAGDVIAEARIVNRGRRLVATETRLLAAEPAGLLLAQVTATYSLPARPALSR
jgi:uncharacterized protein (TIGR00369 family)